MPSFVGALADESTAADDSTAPSASPPSPLRAVPPVGAVPPAIPYVVADRFEYGTLWASVLTLPLAFVTAWLVDSSGLRYLARDVFVNMWLHEWSHALVAWLTGRIAVPLPFITIQFSDERSTMVILVVLALCGALFVAGRREKLRFVQYLAGGLTLLVLVSAVGLSSELTLEWVVFAGCAGEFVLGAFFVLSFFFRLPDKLRWDAWRFPATFYGAYGMVAALGQWRLSHQDLRNLPWGSAIGGSGDMGGDLNRLVYGYDFSAREVADTYYYLGVVCFAAVWAIYLYSVVQIALRYPERLRRWTSWARL